jgi:hypothetical protein
MVLCPTFPACLQSIQPSKVSPPPPLNPGGNPTGGNGGNSGTGMSGTGMSVPSDYALGTSFPSNPNDTFNGPQKVRSMPVSMPSSAASVSGCRIHRVQPAGSVCGSSLRGFDGTLKHRLWVHVAANLDTSQ